MPDVVAFCFQSVELYKGDAELIRLTDATVRDYVELPNYVWEKYQDKTFSPAFFSDYLRLALLTRYGGVWLDATILLSAPLPERYCELPWFAYQRDPQEKNKLYWMQAAPGYFGWTKDFKVKLLSSIIFAQPRQPILLACLALLDNYWREECTLRHYFLFHIYYQLLSEHKDYQHEVPEVESDCPAHYLHQYILGAKMPVKIELAEILSRIPIHKLTYKGINPKALSQLKEAFSIHTTVI